MSSFSIVQIVEESKAGDLVKKGHWMQDHFGTIQSAKAVKAKYEARSPYSYGVVPRVTSDRDIVTDAQRLDSPPVRYFFAKGVPTEYGPVNLPFIVLRGQTIQNAIESELKDRGTSFWGNEWGMIEVEEVGVTGFIKLHID